MNHLIPTSLVVSRQARVAMARERFFEEGQAPTGMVSDAVFESWARCLRTLGSPRETAAFEPVTVSRAQLALQRNRPLLHAWSAELPRLEATLGSTSCAAMLTDARGVLVGSTCVGRAHEALMPIATRLGVNLSEEAVGTTAPGVVARTGKAVNVQGGEHFFDNVLDMHCAAAPIRDIRGRLAGVLDISSERIPFNFDAAVVAGLYAAAIENRLLVSQAAEHLVIRFQVAEELLDSSMVGLVGIDANGLIAWENGVAQRLLGQATGSSGADADVAPPHRLGLDWAHLASLPETGAALLALQNGLLVWARAEMLAADGRRRLFAGSVTGSGACGSSATVRATDEPSPPPMATTCDATEFANEDQPSQVAAEKLPPDSPATPRLWDSNLDLIERTLQSCGGNVSLAARKLGVSRGLIYRRLRLASHSSND